MVFQNANSSARPLPLKQRTSSLDTRRDYSHTTWSSLLVLLKIREYFITVDNFSIWRRHLAWAMENGKDLRSYMTQRYSSNMVFMSLLLSTQLGVLFNSAAVTTNVRIALREGNHFSLEFYAGFMIIISSLSTILSLISVFTAWSMVNSVDENNAHCIFRSSIGQYAAELPGRLIVCSIYSFLVSFILFFFLLLPVGVWSFLLLVLSTAGFVHIVSVFSAFGRVIMHTGAMGKSRIFTPEYEEFLLPHTLHSNLLLKAQANLANNTSIIRQYRRKQQPIDRHLTEDEVYDHLSGVPERDVEDAPYRPRADSTVRFADHEIETIEPGSHFRTLTPLSDSSFHRWQSDGSSHGAIPTSPPAAAIKKKANTTTTTTTTTTTPARPTNLPSSTSGSSRPPVSSMSPFVQTDSMRNVSSSSLEQWLQASSPKVNENDARKTPTSSKTTTTKPSAIHSKTSTPSSSSQRPPKQVSHNRGESNVSQPSGMEVSVDTRSSELTEEERFNLDYGDIDDTRPRGSSDEDYDVVEYLEDEERTSLLPQQGGGQSNYYSSVPREERPPLGGKTSPRPPSR